MNEDIVPKTYSITYLLVQPVGFQLILLCPTPISFQVRISLHSPRTHLVELNSEICLLGLPKD